MPAVCTEYRRSIIRILRTVMLAADADRVIDGGVSRFQDQWADPKCTKKQVQYQTEMGSCGPHTGQITPVTTSYCNPRMSLVGAASLFLPITTDLLPHAANFYS